MSNIILGIDPSLASSGWAIVEKTQHQSFKYVASGTIKTNAKNNLYTRLEEIKLSFDAIFTAYNPTKTIIEVGFVTANGASSLKLAVARGVIIASAIDFATKNSLQIQDYITEVSSTFVKKSITGSGNADKIQVDKMIKMILKDIPPTAIKTNDESDAIAIALSI